MEHRWGQRVGVDLPVRVTGHPFFARTGRLTNLSVSGCFIRADYDVRLLARVIVSIELPHRSKHEAPSIAAFVARKIKNGFGVEWCNFAPPEIAQLLQSLTSRRYVRFRKPDPPASLAHLRLSPPLLKHGT